MSLENAYSLDTPDAAREFYDGWASEYETELAENGYATPLRCAAALKEHATLPEAPLAEFGCGTGLGGLVLRQHGFNSIDGFDIAPEMLARAHEKGIYRNLAELDLSQPLETVPGDTYQNAAAIGVLNPQQMPTTVIDEMLGVLPPGGCLVLSLNDHTLADGSMETRLLELTEYNVADLLFKEHDDHLPGIDLQSSVYVLRKR